MPNTVARTANANDLADFNPEYWATNINAYYQQKTFLTQITNNKWGGGLMHQDGTINIRNQIEVDVFDVVIGNPNPTQRISADMIQLVIDRAKGIQITRHKIDEVQNDIDLFTQATDNAAYQFKVKIEAEILGSVYTNAKTSLPQIALDKTNALDWVLTAGAYLEEEGVPDDGGRYIIMPSFAVLQLQKSDLKNVSITGDAETIARKSLGNGHVGMVGGMNVYSSNQVAKVNGVYQCLAGHKGAIAYASQVNLVEKYPNPDEFGEILRAMQVYGFKVVKEAGLVHMPCDISRAVA
jgi:hypothetical protein